MGRTILVLDDSPDRLEFFRHWLKKEQEVVCVESAEDAIAQLRTRSFDLVFLDHDLGLGAATGEVVADFICSMSPPPPQVVVHSANPVGAARMVTGMREAGVNAGDRNISRLMGSYFDLKPI